MVAIPVVLPLLIWPALFLYYYDQRKRDRAAKAAQSVAIDPQ